MIKRKKLKLDAEEKELLVSFERGEWKTVRHAKEEIQRAEKAASRYIKKDARINIRVSGNDLTGLKRIAVREGLPYQTLVSSVLHKYVANHLGQ